MGDRAPTPSMGDRQPGEMGGRGGATRAFTMIDFLICAGEEMQGGERIGAGSGGGGVAGIAWMTGLLAGLADAGQDVTGVDLVIGTSAGATVAAQLGSSAWTSCSRARSGSW